MAAQKPQAGWWLWSINPLSLILWPLSLVFCLLVLMRRACYSKGLFERVKLSIPVIVVGNITVGGTGKSPLVHALVRLLTDRGYRVGILSRGYKSDHEQQVTLLSHGETSERAGDEANMLSELCACPMAIGADRVTAAFQLLRQFPELQLLISDDGLQHYALARDIEIIVQRKQAFGNGFCLPAGPLREPLSRLRQCDLVLDRDTQDSKEQLGACWNLNNPQQHRALPEFAGQKIYALAGIGFPESYFERLRAAGLDIEAHAFPDHYAYQPADLDPFRDAPVLVTHKDAVKLRKFAADNIWVVPLELTLSDDLQYRLLKLVESKLNG